MTLVRERNELAPFYRDNVSNIFLSLLHLTGWSTCSMLGKHQGVSGRSPVIAD